MHPEQNHPFDELQWIIYIRQVLEKEFVSDDIYPISITTVPKPLLCGKPETYIPQCIAIGPYHHHREELHDMDRYKLSAVKRTQNQLSNLKFQNLVDLIAKLEHRIRAHYYRYLNYNVETLAWMMAIDASFLLEFLQIYVVNEDNTLQRLLSTMPHLIDSIGRMSHNILLRDIIMLENQIPLFILQAILEVRCSSSQIANEVLHSMLVGFLKDLSPLKIIESSLCINVMEYSHLLEFFYYNIVPQSKDQIESNEEIDHDVKSHESVSCMKRLFGAAKDFIFRQTRAFVFKVIIFLVQLPWRVIESLPILSILTQPIKHLLSFEVNQNSKPYNEGPSYADTASLLLEEIMIPSVTELINAGIKFYPTNGDISTIEFNTRTATFHLPVISLDVNSEVVLRNLVAYEASVGSRPLVLSRYIELMNGIIDTMEDAKLLRERGIVLNYLKSDQEVAELWNGMTRSIRLTRVQALDKVIDDVNNYYCSRWRMKIRRFLKRYVVDSWECLVFLAILSFFLIMCIQTFCVSYGCTPWSRDKKS